MVISSPLKRSFGALSRRYRMGFAIEVFKFTFFVLLGAEAIFLSDVLISNLLPKVLDHQAGLLSLMALVAFTTPGVMVIAMPLAILVGSYMIIMSRRQAAEFAVIAGMGLSSRSLIGLVALIGFSALIVSHLLSGFVEPLARYQLSKTLFQVEYDAIREGRIAPGEFYQIGDYAVFASSGQINDAAHQLFVHEKIDEATNRIIMADQSIRMREPQISGLGLLLKDVAIYKFETDGIPSNPANSEQTCINCSEEPDTKALQIMVSDRMFVQFGEADLPSLKPRGNRATERTNLELMQRQSGDRKSVATFGERLLRDLLCFFAPLIGLLAVAMTTNKTYLFALPIAGGGILGAQFLGSYGIKSLAGLGLYGTVTCLILLAAGITLVVTIAILQREREFIRPMGARM